MSSDILIRVENISKKFCRDLKKSLWYGVKDTVNDLFGRDSLTHDLRSDEFWALDDVSFELCRGECLGLIGRNGAGKTTLLKLLNGLIKPDRGRIEIRGRVGALIALGSGFNPILTGRENIYINGSVLGLSKKEVNRKIEDILDFAEIPDEFIDAPVQSYSSGMQMRLGFAVATAMEPDILLIDEVLAVGDYRFRWKCLQRIKSLVEKQVCIILVSHNSHDLMRTCSIGLVIENGRKTFCGAIDEAVLGYESNTSGEVTPIIAERIDAAAKRPVQLTSIEFNVDGSRASKMRSGQGLAIEVKMHSEITIDQARVVLGLFHSEFGALFHVSSFGQKGWIKISKGKGTLLINLGRLPLQYGSYYVELTVRGPGLSDFYATGRGPRSLNVSEPLPNYEGFGINGVLLPVVDWRIQFDSSLCRDM